jgi:hypothetical protein
MDHTTFIIRCKHSGVHSQDSKKGKIRGLICKLMFFMVIPKVARLLRGYANDITANIPNSRFSYFDNDGRFLDELFVDAPRPHFVFESLLTVVCYTRTTKSEE